MGFQVSSFKHKRRIRRMSQVSNKSLSSIPLQEMYSTSNRSSSSSIKFVTPCGEMGDQIIAKIGGGDMIGNIAIPLATNVLQTNVFLSDHKSTFQTKDSIVEYNKPTMEIEIDSKSNDGVGTIILKEEIQTLKDLCHLSLESQNVMKDMEGSNGISPTPIHLYLDDYHLEASSGVEEKKIKNETRGLQDHIALHQKDLLSGLPQNTLYRELGFDAIFFPIENVDRNINMKEIGVEAQEVNEVDANKHELDVKVQEDILVVGDANAQKRIILDVGENAFNMKISQVHDVDSKKNDNDIQQDFEESDEESIQSESLHGQAIGGSIILSSEPNATTLGKFESDMVVHWKLRVSILECFKKMSNIDIKLCPCQCIYLIKTYLGCESILCMHPSEYLNMVGDNQETIQWLQSCLNAFIELSNIMRHGALLIWNCISDEWITNALTMMSGAPSRKHPNWKAISSFSINLKKFEWILSIVAIAIKSVSCVNGVNIVDMDHDLFTCTLTISLLDSYEDLEAKDRDNLLQNLLYFVQKSHSNEQKDDIDLAQFLILKLQGQNLLNDEILLDQSKGPFIQTMPKKIKTIGAGASRIVCEGDWLGVKVAIKEIYEMRAFKLEEEFVDLHHPHIVSTFDHGMAPKKGCIVMELMEGDLLTFIQDHPHEAPSLYEQDFDLIMQIAEALKYLNTNGVLHRDLKSQNIMIKPCKCGNARCMIAKLGDFGISKYNGMESRFTTKKVGTQGWMAPEIMSKKSQTKYTTAVDVYSFAITCSEILSRKDPCEGIVKFKDHREQTLAGKRPNLPEEIPSLLSAYIKRCWATNASDRPQDFHAVCEFLQYFKEVLLRGGTLESILPEVKERDAQMLFTHLGLPWCLQRDRSSGTLTHIPEDLYEYVINVAMKDKTWTRKLSEEEESNIHMEIANYFGNWTSIGRDYNAAFQILENLTNEGKCGVAIWRLGYCYELGLGVDQNFEKAANLYKDAVFEADYGYALIDLGYCYVLGQGVPQSIQKGSLCWDAALNCQPLLIDSIKEQLLMFQKNEFNLLTTSKKQRQEAARRLLNLTLISSGRKLLSKALDDEKLILFEDDEKSILFEDDEKSILLEDDQLRSKNLEIESRQYEDLEFGLQSPDDQAKDEDKTIDTNNERSVEELIILREIFMHLRVDETTVLKGVETIMSKDKKSSEANSVDNYIEEVFQSLRFDDHRLKISNFEFYVFFTSFCIWFMFSIFKPWSNISSFLTPNYFITIFTSFSSVISLRILYSLVIKLYNRTF